MKLYRIKDWDGHYENNRTRELKKLDWVPIPNKQDGDGYTRLVEGENGASMLGAWVAVVQVASRCGMRGTLMRAGGKPHDLASLSRITRLPEKIIREMLELTCSDEIGWMEFIEIKEDISFPQDGAEKSQETDASRACAYTREERNRREENGREYPAVAGTQPDAQTEMAQEPETEPEKPNATPQARTRQRDEIWDTVSGIWFDGNVTSAHRKRCGKITSNLRELGATADEIKIRLQRYRTEWPNAEATPEALVKHWHRFAKGQTNSDTFTAEKLTEETKRAILEGVGNADT